MNAIADRLLAALVPGGRAEAACTPKSWTEQKYVDCPGGMRVCTRRCSTLSNCSTSCTTWSCGGCNKA
ncbi:hypothetical protein [Phytomonospora endophytica]|uniref:Uncharacterized protein n=1 Tax=Phytomonospora endophytica TaxID=714109 RepID=A0A841FSS7_9ACTN|nr:hypothetical protein [Phytomonospora endophytica]MBB6037863.1 hypothetical protein [Phytomonospora endophytica]